MEIKETQALRDCAALANAVMTAGAKIGRVVGPSGTGKTVASKHLVAQLDAVRVCAHQGISPSVMMQRLARGFGIDPRSKGASALMDPVADAAQGRLMVIDEANHLRWQHMELLRYLPDERDAGLILIGTELLERSFVSGRNAVYLKQLAGRIGTKQVHLKPMTAKEIAAYLLLPRFGAVSKTVGEAFYRHGKGYWRESAELADGCQRVMDSNQISDLTVAVIQAAVKSMAGGAA